MLGGIRHLTWVPARLGPNEREWLAVATVVDSVRLTIVIDSVRAVLTSQKR